MITYFADALNVNEGKINTNMSFLDNGGDSIKAFFVCAQLNKHNHKISIEELLSDQPISQFLKEQNSTNENKKKFKEFSYNKDQIAQLYIAEAFSAYKAYTIRETIEFSSNDLNYEILNKIKKYVSKNSHLFVSQCKEKHNYHIHGKSITILSARNSKEIFCELDKYSLADLKNSRVMLILWPRDNGNRHSLTICASHIYYDGWSIDILLCQTASNNDPPSASNFDPLRACL